MGKTIIYDKKPIVVSNEVAEFLETDRKRQAAQERSDRRHISKSSSETVSGPYYSPYTSDVETVVFKNLMLENLHQALGALPPKERKLIELYYFDGNTMERIGKIYGISKMAVSKHIKKLLVTLRNLMESWDSAFYIFLKIGLQMSDKCPLK